MKEIKDKFVPDILWYLVSEYLHDTYFAPIYRRKLEKYDEKTGRPYFSLKWVDFKTFDELTKEALNWFWLSCEDITEETIDKYAEK